MKICELTPDQTDFVEQTAALLVAAFHEPYPMAWPTVTDALAELAEMLVPGRINRLALDEDAGIVLGYVGGIPEYEGHVWEVHPLAVHPAYQRQGVGRALLADLEQQVMAKGGLTLWLGSDDESGTTNLFGVDMYEDFWGKIAGIQNLKDHPYSFYQRCGFVIAGIVPDANGYGKPDILMAKRVQQNPDKIRD